MVLHYQPKEAEMKDNGRIHKADGQKMEHVIFDNEEDNEKEEEEELKEGEKEEEKEEVIEEVKEDESNLILDVSVTSEIMTTASIYPTTPPYIPSFPETNLESSYPSHVLSSSSSSSSSFTSSSTTACKFPLHSQLQLISSTTSFPLLSSSSSSSSGVTDTDSTSSTESNVDNCYSGVNPLFKSKKNSKNNRKGKNRENESDSDVLFHNNSNEFNDKNVIFYDLERESLLYNTTTNNYQNKENSENSLSMENIYKNTNTNINIKNTIYNNYCMNYDIITDQKEFNHHGNSITNYETLNNYKYYDKNYGLLIDEIPPKTDSYHRFNNSIIYENIINDDVIKYDIKNDNMINENIEYGNMINDDMKNQNIEDDNVINDMNSNNTIMDDNTKNFVSENDDVNIVKIIDLERDQNRDIIVQQVLNVHGKGNNSKKEVSFKIEINNNKNKYLPNYKDDVLLNDNDINNYNSDNTKMNLSDKNKNNKPESNNIINVTSNHQLNDNNVRNNNNNNNDSNNKNNMYPFTIEQALFVSELLYLLRPLVYAWAVHYVRERKRNFLKIKSNNNSNDDEKHAVTAKKDVKLNKLNKSDKNNGALNSNFIDDFSEKKEKVNDDGVEVKNNALFDSVSDMLPLLLSLVSTYYHTL